MDLALSEEQSSAQAVFRALFEKSQTLARVRSAGKTGFDPELWRSMCTMGAPGIAVAEADGGAGAGLIDAALVCEQGGHYLAPVPYVETCVAARLLASAEQSTTLQEVLAGSTVATFTPEPSRDGCWHSVPNGSIAELVIGISEDRLIASGPAAPPPALPNLADLPICDRSPDADTSTVIASGPAAIAAFADARDQWRALAAAWLVGLAGGALDIGVRYVKERVQFDVPLGSFQSIAHHLADCHAAIDGARLLCQEAAWSLDQSAPDASALAAMAFYFAAQTAEQVAGWSLHFHGGYGFMLEYDIQLFYRRAKAWSLLHGDRDRILDDIAAQVFTANSAA